MDLKELIKKVEDLNKRLKQVNSGFAETKLEMIKQTVEAFVKYVEAFDNELPQALLFSHGWKSSKSWSNKLKDYEKLKTLLEIKQ